MLLRSVHVISEPIFPPAGNPWKLIMVDWVQNAKFY